MKCTGSRLRRREIGEPAKRLRNDVHDGEGRRRIDCVTAECDFVLQ